MDLLSLVSLGVFTFTYGVPMRLVAITAQRRYEYRTGQRLHWAWACVYGALWPVLMAVWIVAVLALPFEKRPASLVYEPSKADRAAVALDRRKEERSPAIQDWQARASHWFELGKQAEEENDQALKWAVAENLTFLLETKPDGAQVKGLTEPEKVSVSPETGQETIEMSDLDKPIEGWAAYSERQRALKARMQVQKRNVPNLYLKSVRLDESNSAAKPAIPCAAHVGGNAVGFCNACYCYHKPEQMTMKGLCNECAIEQGF
jgi:hypothetical protein